MNLTELEKKLIRKRIAVLSDRILAAGFSAANYSANLEQQKKNMEVFEGHLIFTNDYISKLQKERLELLRELNEVKDGFDDEEAAMGLADGDPI